jgi:hypothetical protein
VDSLRWHDERDIVGRELGDHGGEVSETASKPVEFVADNDIDFPAPHRSHQAIQPFARTLGAWYSKWNGVLKWSVRPNSASTSTSGSFFRSLNSPSASAAISNRLILTPVAGLSDLLMLPRDKGGAQPRQQSLWVFPRLECQFVAGTSINTSAGAQLFDSPKTTSFSAPKTHVKPDSMGFRNGKW